jgi:hypothetical protein
MLAVYRIPVAGGDPATHVLADAPEIGRKTWTAGTSPAEGNWHY